MKIDKKTVEKLAYYAQMNIPESEIDNELSRLENMVTVIKEIRCVDTENVAPMSNPFDDIQRLYPDVALGENRRDDYQKATKFTENGLYIVPQVIE